MRQAVCQRNSLLINCCWFIVYDTYMYQLINMFGLAIHRFHLIFEGINSSWKKDIEYLNRASIVCFKM